MVLVGEGLRSLADSLRLRRQIHHAQMGNLHCIALTGPPLRTADLWIDVLLVGTSASLLSSAALMTCGHLDRGRALATHNGPAQWVYGTQAAKRRSVDWRHTGVGFLVHHASSCFWACIQQRWLRHGGKRKRAHEHLIAATTVATVAYVVDYHAVPRRLQPGFENHVSPAALIAAYGAFALGLALGAYLVDRNRAHG
jgi:hypothetical protein